MVDIIHPTQHELAQYFSAVCSLYCVDIKYIGMFILLVVLVYFNPSSAAFIHLERVTCTHLIDEACAIN